MQIKIQKPKRNYRWVVEYQSGKTFSKGEVEFKKVLEADQRGEVKRFALLPLVPGLKELVVNLDQNKRLIYFERTIGNTGNEFRPFLVYLLGWQETIKGVNSKVIMYVYPNGNIEINNDEATLIDAYIIKEKQNGL